ncbi:MAG: bestrophin family ion channel [Gemmataceae bacterium]|nr:hypothetical protein [Gemmata sp.]MDW8198280.1 bestrophin family ion channel [Gemmataceae bacterium]
MRSRPQLQTWIWPPPPVARRLWLTILGASLYSLAVYLLGGELIAALPGWSSEFGLVNGIVLGVLVAIRTRAAFDRWTEGQRLWAELMIHARNLALKVAYLTRASTNDRQRTQQLVAAFPVAVIHHLQSDHRRPSVARFTTNSPPPNPLPADIAGRLYAQAALWHTEGQLDLPGLWAIETNIRALMDAAGHCERIIQPPVPPSFHALLRHGLLLSLVLAPWHLIHALGLWALPVQALIIYFLFGIELTAEEIENPFGHDVDDLPLQNYCQRIQGEVAAILAAAEPPQTHHDPAPAALDASVATVTEEPSR